MREKRTDRAKAHQDTSTDKKPDAVSVGGLGSETVPPTAIRSLHRRQ